MRIEDRGYARLLLAIVTRAINDLDKPRFTNDAKRWLTSKSRRPFSYLWIKEALDLFGVVTPPQRGIVATAKKGKAKMKKTAAAVLVAFIAGAAMAGTAVLYSVRWEQTETEWCEVEVYGQAESVYLTYNASWRPLLTIHFPADVGAVVGAQMIQAAKDAQAQTAVNHE